MKPAIIFENERGEVVFSSTITEENKQGVSLVLASMSLVLSTKLGVEESFEILKQEAEKISQKKSSLN